MYCYSGALLNSSARCGARQWCLDEALTQQHNRARPETRMSEVRARDLPEPPHEISTCNN